MSMSSAACVSIKRTVVMHLVCVKLIRCLVISSLCVTEEAASRTIGVCCSSDV